MLVPALSPTNRVTLGQPFHFSGPRFHYLLSGYDGTFYLLGVLWGLIQPLTRILNKWWFFIFVFVLSLSSVGVLFF